MKKISILFLFLVLGSASLISAETVNTEDTSWFVQMNGDTSFPTGNLTNRVNQGWGGEGSLGYRFSRDAELSVESGYDTFSGKQGTNNTWNIVPLILKAQYSIGDDMIRPYGFVGAGVSFNSQSTTFGGFTGSNAEVDFLDEFGVGLSLVVTEKVFFFVQGKMEMDFTSSNYSSDQPTLLFPLNAGLQFELD
jgi:hypothetical protein